jgi:hypothetical protein
MTGRSSESRSPANAFNRALDIHLGTFSHWLHRSQTVIDPARALSAAMWLKTIA